MNWMSDRVLFSENQKQEKTLRLCALYSPIRKAQTTKMEQNTNNVQIGAKIYMI